MTGQSIREFFRSLFQSELVVQLRADLEEARRERDYHKGRAERLDLVLAESRRTVRDPQSVSGSGRERSSSPVVGGRKTWSAIVGERREELRRKAEDVAGNKPSTPSTKAAN